jgi:hypothetical protein
MRIPFAAAVAGLVAVSSLASAQVDPRGIFHNQFSGSFSGTEWFQTIPIAGQPGRYRLADLFSGGFNGAINSAGAIVLDGGVGTGSFSSPDAYIVTPNLSGTVFTFNNVRAPATTPDFPLELVSAVNGNAILAGVYTSTTTQLNPRTGAVLGGGNEQVTIAVTGATYRITDPGGLFFQGVFESPTNIGFRFVTPTPSDARFRSFPGSSINFTQNMVGQATIVDVNTWTAIILLQSRTSLGNQTQLAFRFQATRTNPLPAGDLNGDRLVDETDRSLLAAQVGNEELDDAFNVAADLVRDGVIDAADVAAFNAILPLDCPGDTDGDNIVNFTDLNTVLSAFGTTGIDLPGDLNGNGIVDFGDLNEVLSNFGATCG